MEHTYVLAGSKMLKDILVESGLSLHVSEATREIQMGHVTIDHHQNMIPEFYLKGNHVIQVGCDEIIRTVFPADDKER